MAYFHMKLVPPRPSFPHDATGEEMAAMKEHADYWLRQTQAGTAIAVGPVFDPRGAWGMAVVEVDDADAVQALIEADPVTIADLGFSYEVSPMPSLLFRQSGAATAV
ncbi:MULTISPECIES: YciI family protein [unclassified Sinorhizobium]|uniref:YciI family protein n=1 Tax=unclassified Sinorhizobium TaxID=2613772 RepID=UPI00352587FD